ncbi:MAG: PKD domain-containing protein [Saprospiraceae bacterium]
MKKYLTVLLLVFILIPRSKAAHIIGGEMYYECLGYGKDSTFRKYLITIKLYRDCRPQQNAAGFDRPLGFSIYRKNSTGNGYTQVRGNANQGEYSIQTFQGPDSIAAPSYPCLIIPPDICVEQGLYTYEVELPIINQEYVIVWQRCCRNNTITNILNPGNTGATFTVSISPEAQKWCNSSPQFKNFPPTVICVNNPLNFDHSAIDKDGDLLVYSFCEPFAGGGSGGGGGGGGGNCNSVTPTPDCPPPFTPVNFKAPQYGYLFPMGGNPPVSINSITGLITGEPNVQGQFVMTVCCSEYRNGTLLSTIRRDFQFNVASCQGTVVAALNSGKEVSRQNYEILICNADSFQMDNGSYQQQFINDILWEYQTGGQTVQSTLWNPLLRFSEGGPHDGHLFLNPGTNCSDTVAFHIQVIKDLKADFSFSFDSCKAGPVNFKNLSTSPHSAIQTWSWDLGDGFKSFEQNFNLQYIHPDEYAVRLDISDNYGCKNNTTKIIKWFPAPDVIVFRPSTNEGCVPLTVNFKNVSFPTDSSYKFHWIFSDSTSADGITVNHTFDTIGEYGLSLQVRSPLGCFSEGRFDRIIKVYPPPSAVASLDPLRLNINNATVKGYDSTQQTIGRTWIIDGKDYFFDKDLFYTFEDTGVHSIRLIVSDKFLCTDTIDREVYVFRDFSLYMPNAFTPNGDGLNELFQPVGQINDLLSYRLAVYDRWGGLIFETSDPKSGWNGKFSNAKDAEGGVYIYTLEFQRNRYPLTREKNIFTLIR